MTRALRFIVHNWPLKLAAVVLASVLYGGLVLSQTTQTFPGSVPIVATNASSDVIVLSSLGSVSGIRYVAPPDLGLRIDSSSFVASVDLGGVDATRGRVTRTVGVEAVDPRVQVLGSSPREIVVTLDLVASRSVPVRAVQVGPTPSGMDVGEPTVDVSTAEISGPQSVVTEVTEVQARFSVDASGIDINQVVDLVPVDAAGEQRVPIDVEPASARVRLAVFSDRRSKTLPVTPNVVGSPAAGFEIAAIDVSPPTISVEGDANDLAGLDRATTAQISIAGASSLVSQEVGLSLPTGVQALGTGTVTVRVTLRPIIATRTFEAGLALVGASSNRDYNLSTDRVLVTIGGPLAELDRLSGATLVLTVDVTGLEVGTHPVPVSANLQTGLTLVDASPNPIDVTVSAPTPTPGATAGPGPTP